MATTSSSKRRSGSCTASAAMPWTAERVGMRATRTPSARACSAAAAAVWRRSASLGSSTTSRAWARRTASTSSPLAGGSPGAREHGGRARLGAQPGQPLPGHDGDDGALDRAPAAAVRRRRCARRRSPKWVIRIRYGRPASTPASTAAPASSTCTWTFHRPSPPTTTSESPSPSSRVRSRATAASSASRR